MSAQFLAVTCSLFFVDPPNEKADEKPTEQELVKAGRAVIAPTHKTLLESLAGAGKEIKGGVPIEIKAENPRSEKLFGVYLLKGDVLHEVEFDVVTSKVVKSKEKTVSPERLSQFKTMTSRCKLSFTQAVERAQEKCKTGKPIRVRIEEKQKGEAKLVHGPSLQLTGSWSGRHAASPPTRSLSI